MTNWGDNLLAGGCVLGSAIASWIVPVLADAALPSNLPALDFGNLTSTAILGWYAWHTQTKTIPKLTDDFRNAVEKQRDDFRAELATERTTNDAILTRLETKIESLKP